MGMTEKQGGSDVRSNTTRATPVGSGGPGGEYVITGHKWFFSCPQNDAHLVLAQAPGGLSCFFRSEEHTSELQSLMRISYAVFCLKKKKYKQYNHNVSIP